MEDRALSAFYAILAELQYSTPTEDMKNYLQGGLSILIDLLEDKIPDDAYRQAEKVL